MKKAIVTCLFGNYDELKPAPNYSGWDCILFTDSEPSDSKGWDVRVVEPTTDPKRQSRYYKIMLHKVLPEYYLYCYMDANMVLSKEPPSFPIWGIHPANRNVFQEGHRIIKLGKETSAEVRRQLTFYQGNRLRGIDPITMNGFFVRRNVDQINSLCDLWWEQIKQFSHRDQLSLGYVFEATNQKMENIVPFKAIKQYFRIASEHLVVTEKPTPNIHHITAGRADKDIGRAINEIVRGLPDDDWICLRDIDTFPTHHREFFKQCEDIAKAGDYQLVSCMTNRIGLQEQRYEGIESDDMDIRNHVKVGMKLFEKFGSQVKPTRHSLAGIMMLFPKSIWITVGGFDEGGILNNDYKFHDYSFSMKVKRAKGKLGIAKGIYLFHLYRMGFEHPTKHLY